MKPNQTYYCKTSATLLESLLKHHGSTATKVKKLLKSGQVLVNNSIIKLPQHPCQEGDKLEIQLSPSSHKPTQHQQIFEVLFEDEYVIAVNKPAGLLTVDDENQSTNLFKLLKNVYPEIYIVHRLDREVTGLILFAKDINIADDLQDSWPNFEKKYFAVVEGVPQKASDTLIHYLENKGPTQVHVSNDSSKGKKAITHYQVKQKGKAFCTLEIVIDTGKKNQIRAQLSHIGHPIVGDKKFGSQYPFDKRIALHAHELKLTHPFLKTELTITCPPPHTLINLTKDKNTRK